MVTFLLHSRAAWEDHFSVVYYPNSQLYTSRQTPSGTSVYISNCLFRSISSGSDGGALYCSSVTYLLVESTSFFSCKTSSHGGAIYFTNSGGQCVLYEVCGYDCCSTYSSNYPHYQFAYIRVNNAISSKNNVNYSSIVRCVNERSSGSYYTLYLVYGKICCPSVNISMNKCYYRTIYCQPLSDSNYVTCSFSYSTITDNIATGYTCFCLAAGGTNYEIKSCNIIRNTQTVYPNSEGTIITWGNLMINDSCILENNANRIFHQGNSNYRITLSNCTVDKTTNNGYLTTQNTATKSFILALNHMSTLNCHSEYDVFGTLTPIIQSPSSSKKQIPCFTFQNFFFQSRLRDFISLISVFLFQLYSFGYFYWFFVLKHIINYLSFLFLEMIHKKHSLLKISLKKF
jgi:hypothetical protein